jgi:16S rRNA (guanine1207-N2)-methyltransferase
MEHTDIYFKKEIGYRTEGISLTFRVSQSLFSSHQIDKGTQNLLKTVSQLELPSEACILDLGCGYGPLGLTLAKRFPGSYVHLVDRDALAVAYAHQNAALNALGNCKVYSSLGYDDVVAHNYDLIISNIPGKAGDRVISSLLMDAQYHLNPDGIVAVVVVAPLEPLVTSILDQPGIQTLYRDVSSEHVVFHYRFTHPSSHDDFRTGVERGIYQRASMEISGNRFGFEAETAFGLPEFDTLDYQTSLLIKVIESQPPGSARRVVIYNPGQGHLPLVMWQLYKPESIILVSRDLLSLRYAERNLLQYGCPESRLNLAHQPDWALGRYDAASPDEQKTMNSVDCIVAVLRSDENSEIISAEIKQVIDAIQVGGTMYVTGGSTPVTRLIKSVGDDKRLLLKKRRKYQGKSVALFQRRKV